MISVKEFRQDFFQDIQSAAYASGCPYMDALFEVVGDHLVETGELETAERAFYQAARGIRIDGYGGDPLTSGTLTIIILDSEQIDEEITLTATDMNAVFKRATSFVSKSLEPAFREGMEFSDPAFGLADLINTRWAKIDKIKIVLITDKILSSRVDGRSSEELDGKTVVHSVWDISRLHSLVIAGRGREEIAIDLEGDFGGSIPALNASSKNSTYDAYLLVIKGEQLAEIYDKWDSRLLESNVRVFLQARGGVNKGIRNTIENSPGMFLAYNNGVTATADSVETVKIDGSLHISKINNLQIVNGGQTTASIHAAYKKKTDLSQVFVQLKLSVIEPDLASEIVPKISEYANSQNKVSAADFFSNHAFHIRMEKFSRGEFVPSADGSFRQTKWFYERARGQYQDQRTKATNTKKFDTEFPKHQVFSKTDLAKYQMVFLQNPDTASKGAQKNFAAFASHIGSQWDKNSESFNLLYYRESISMAIIFKATEKIVQAQPWYEGGYRANVVAYALSKIAFDLNNLAKSFDFMTVWRAQGLDLNLQDAITRVSEDIHARLIDPPAGQKNISEWAKQQSCWEAMKKLKITYPEKFLEACQSLNERLDDVREAQQDQKGADGVSDYIMVVNAGAAYWKEVIEWGREKKLLSPKEASILQICANLPNKIPSEAQASFAMRTVERLNADGLSIEMNMEAGNY